MILPKIPKNEKERLEALLSYHILDTSPERDFDDIVKLASEICQTPIAALAFIDKNRQWLKSKIGIDTTEYPRELSFSAHTINHLDKNLVVENALKDDRFSENPLVVDSPNIRFYAGVSLVNAQGLPLGTLCVVDIKPRKLDDFQFMALEKLANQVLNLLELRRKNFILAENHNSLLARYQDLEQFASVVSHDLKSPLNNIMMLAKLLKDSNSSQLDADGNQMVDYIYSASEELKKLVDAILNYYKYDNEIIDNSEKIRLNDFMQYVIAILDTKHEFEFILPEKNHKFLSNKIALGQILFNLIGNSIKYNDKPKGIIKINFEESDEFYIISVADNGIGIEKANFKKVFNAFETLGKTDRFQSKGSGFGLSTVQKVVHKLNGKIELNSELGIGTEFKVYLKK